MRVSHYIHHTQVDLTILQLRLLNRSHRDQATQSLRFPLFLVDLRA